MYGLLTLNLRELTPLATSWLLTTYLFYENPFQNITYIVNIAGEWDLEVFDNQLTNWAARKIIMITGNTFLPVEFVCMYVS